MTYTLTPRTAIGLDPVVRSTNGTPRPAIAQCRWMTLHWTGVNVAYGDPGDTPAEIRAIERYAQGAGKPNEYNYVIGQDADALVYEYAGGFQAAHSAGENGQAVGVLFLNGINEPVTPLQIDKARWLRDVLRYFGVLRSACEVTPHRDMPGGATQCPGDRIAAAAAVIAQPWQAPAPPKPTPPPPPSSVESVLLTRVQSGDGWWALARRCYAGDVAANAARMQAANAGVTLRPGELVNVPGRAS